MLRRHHKHSQNRKRKSNKLTFGIFVSAANQGERMRCHAMAFGEQQKQVVTFYDWILMNGIIIIVNGMDEFMNP